MDEQLLKQLLRQIKIVKFWVTLFGVILVIGLAIIGFLLYQAITFAQDAATKVDTIQQQASESLNFKDQACADGGVGSLLRAQTELCQ